MLGHRRVYPAVHMVRLLPASLPHQWHASHPPRCPACRQLTPFVRLLPGLSFAHSCRKSCFGCFHCGFGDPSCSYALLHGIPGTCCDGYECCSRCCSTCSSCSGSGKSRHCHSYSCNCHCCDFTSNQACSVRIWWRWRCCMPQPLALSVCSWASWCVCCVGTWHCQVSCRTCYNAFVDVTYGDTDGDQHQATLEVRVHESSLLPGMSSTLARASHLACMPPMPPCESGEVWYQRVMR